MNVRPSSAPKKPFYSNSIALILTFCIISALFIYLVYSQNFIFGSISGNWTNSYFENIVSIPRWIPISVLILLGIAIFVGSKLILSHEKLTLVGCLLVAFTIQILIRSVYPVTLGTIVQSENANSFYSPAMRYSPFQILAQYDKLVPTFPYHANSNMPGKILLFQFFKPVTSSPQAMGYLVILVSTTGALLLYGICKILFHDRQTALYALLLYTLVPSKLFFFPILNTVTPLFILLCLYFFVVYIERKQMRFLWLSGVAFYILILFDPSPLVTGLIFVGILIHAVLEKRFGKKNLGRLLLIPLISFISVYAIFLVFFSFNLLQVFRSVLEAAVSYNLQENHGYWIWVIENVKEFFYDAGLPVMMIFVYQVCQVFSQPKLLKSIAGWSIETIFVLCLLVTLCTVDLLGINRGEITRLWIYLAVLFQVPASFFIAKIPYNRAIFFLVSSTLVIQSLITLNRISFINP